MWIPVCYSFPTLEKSTLSQEDEISFFVERKYASFFSRYVHLCKYVKDAVGSSFPTSPCYICICWSNIHPFDYLLRPTFHPSAFPFLIISLFQASNGPPFTVSIQIHVKYTAKNALNVFLALLTLVLGRHYLKTAKLTSGKHTRPYEKCITVSVGLNSLSSFTECNPNIRITDAKYSDCSCTEPMQQLRETNTQKTVRAEVIQEAHVLWFILYS